MPAPHAERLSRLREMLERERLEGLLISQPESRYYLSGYTGHDLPPRDSAGYLLITRQKAFLLTDRRTSEQAEQEVGDVYEVVPYATRALGPQTIADLAKGAVGHGRIAFEGIHLPYAIWQDVRSSLDGNGLELAPTVDLVDRLRIVKDAAELAQLQEAVDVLDRCFGHVVDWLRAGVTERDVAKEVEAYLLREADGPSFASIVASGPNGSMPHAVPSDRVIQEAEGITIDIGARAAYYCSDMTRTISLGEPQDKRLREIHEVVLEAQLAVETQVRPGMSGREADAIARGIIERAGYGEHFTHGTGHGIGLEVHEPPWVSHTLGDDPLRAGMVFSVEPGVYIPGWGGVRIEDLVVLEEDGARVLCRSPKGLVQVAR